MNIFTTAPRKIASIAALSAATFLGACATAPEKPIDKIANANKAADCMVDSIKGKLAEAVAQKDGFSRLPAPGSKEFAQYQMDSLRACLAEGAGVSLDKVPLFPDLSSDISLEEIESSALAVRDFTQKYIDDKAFQERLLSRFSELLEWMLKDIAPESKVPPLSLSPQ